MILDATTRKLQILMDATAATTESPVVANWVDTTATATTPGSTNSISNGTSAVDVVAAPAASTQRIIQSIAIYNADTVNRTVTVRYNDNATTRIIVKVLLNPGQSLCYTAHAGWQVVTAVQSGADKASFRANKNATDQTGILPTTLTKITFTTEVWDTGSYYDAANSKWTPPAGIVLVSGMILYSAGTVDQSQTGIVLYKNGAEFGDNFQTPSGSGSLSSQQVTMVDIANGTDYYEIYAYAAGAGNKTVAGAVTNTWFQGSML